MRLDRYLSTQTIFSRKEIKTFLKSGQVQVNGLTAKKAEQKIIPGADRIALNSEEVLYQQYVYIMMNKPAGVICASEDKKQKTVMDILPQTLQRKNLFPAGRLDKDTTGFVLLTDDGNFAHSILSPNRRIYKTYEALVAGRITQQHIHMFANGLLIDHNIQCQKASLTILKQREDVLAEVVICEGKFHQVKRMFQAIGCTVKQLKRVKIGNLSLDESLRLGESRLLSTQEKSQIIDKTEAKSKNT